MKWTVECCHTASNGDHSAPHECGWSSSGEAAYQHHGDLELARSECIRLAAKYPRAKYRVVDENGKDVTTDEVTYAEATGSGEWIVEFHRESSGWNRSGNRSITVSDKHLSELTFDTKEAAEKEASEQHKHWGLKYRATQLAPKGETMATESQQLIDKLAKMASASKTPSKSATTHHADIVRHEGAIMVPKTMTYLQAAKLLVDRNEYEEQVISMSRSYDAFWHDGAVALDAILTDRYGWSPMQPTPTWFGPKPPQMINVECSYGTFKSVPWGRFFIPGVEAVLDMGINMVKGRQVFTIQGEKIARKWQPQVDQLFDLVAAELQANSIYKGKAWRLDITGAASLGETPLPKLVDTDIDPDTLIYSRHVTDAVETNVFTPLRRYSDLKKSGLPFKRGVLLSGTFGTGKTLAAKVASKYAVESGITFIVCCHAVDLASCVEYARLYQPSVVFVEDIDRELAGERDSAMDNILNVVDGIDSKKADVMIVLTSNNVESINQAMLRPGRLDAVIDVTPPDAEAVERLLRFYGRGVIPLSEDVSEAAKTLENAIPAVIAEVVKRARLAALKLTEPGTSRVTVTSAAITEAAATMKMQLDLLYGKKAELPVITLESVVTSAVKSAINGHTDLIDNIHEETDGNKYKLGKIMKALSVS